MIIRTAISGENPTSLFKYCRVDRYSLSNLIRGDVWFSAPSSFNDPFDSLLLFNMDISDEEIVAHLNSCAASRGEPQKYTLADAEEERATMVAGLRKAEEAVRTSGVFSLSATPYEILLWSHYADHHRGFCIEYERTATNELGSKACRPVVYRDDLCPIVGGLEFFRTPEGVIHTALYSKAGCWAYELEWRLVYVTSGGEMHRARPLSARIKSVTFGLRTPPSDIATITRLLASSPDIEFYLMQTRGFRLELEPVLLDVQAHRQSHG